MEEYFAFYAFPRPSSRPSRSRPSSRPSAAHPRSPSQTLAPPCPALGRRTHDASAAATAFSHPPLASLPNLLALSSSPRNCPHPHGRSTIWTPTFPSPRYPLSHSCTASPAPSLCSPSHTTVVVVCLAVPRPSCARRRDIPRRPWCGRSRSHGQPPYSAPSGHTSSPCAQLHSVDAVSPWVCATLVVAEVSGQIVICS
ncbi:uncharacterized protein [Zea mays]|uniref:uncharacterized protein n=1 Tax=Zea mays TaxID=4577 RepID=UPI001651D280|nr:uncharacterized protein LOC118477093 [Zea mays]